MLLLQSPRKSISRPRRCNQAVEQFNLGLAKLPQNQDGLYNIATASRLLSQIDQDKANAALAAGHADQAAQYNVQSQQIDAPRTSALSRVHFDCPAQRHA